MALPVLTSPMSTSQHTLKRHDTGLALSESPPPPLVTRHQEQKQMTRTRRNSTSTQSSTQSSDTSQTTRTRFHAGLLMPDAPPDLQHEARHASYRRRVCRDVFGKDMHLDWKSAPVVCDERYDYASLLYRRELRCVASRQYLYEVYDDLKQKALQRTCWKMVDPSDDVAQVVCIDGEEMIDMVG